MFRFRVSAVCRYPFALLWLCAFAGCQEQPEARTSPVASSSGQDPSLNPPPGLAAIPKPELPADPKPTDATLTSQAFAAESASREVRPGPSSEPRQVQAVAGGSSPRSGVLESSAGQLVYVPAYSHINHSEGQKFLLAVTLSVRNSSPTDSIMVRSVRYYDSGGGVLKEYAKSGVKLAPLAATEFFVPESDSRGGSGASFLVDWVAARGQTTAPVIEAVMISTRSQQGLAFVTGGRVVKEYAPGGG